GDEDRDPGVRGVGADELRLARRRQGFEVAADVAGGQAERAQRGDHELGEVLADAAAVFEDFGDRRGNGGETGVEGEFAEDAPVEGGDGIEHAAARGEIGGGEAGEFLRYGNE